MSNLTNKKNLNEAIVRAVQRNWYAGFGEKRDYSVTQLLVPPKIFHLMNRHKDEIEEDVSEKMFMLMGSAMHAILERANDYDVEFAILSRVRAFFEKVHNGEVVGNPREIETSFISFIIGDEDIDTGQRLGYLLSLLPKDRYLIEKRFKYITKTGKVISGGIDLYDRETRTLHDYKFSSVWTWIYRNRPGNRTEEWTQQLNMYRLFLERQGYSVDKLCINLIMRDYSKSKARQDASYPEPVETIELPLLGLDVVEQIIENRVEEIEKYAMTKDDAIPPCTPYERWQQHDTYAIYKIGNKTASKVEFSYAGAKAWMETEIAKLAEKDIQKGMDTQKATQRATNIFRIEKRPGMPTRCIDYCSVCQFCNFYRELPEKVKLQ
jgi:hypothetical protein